MKETMAFLLTLCLQLPSPALAGEPKDISDWSRVMELRPGTTARIQAKGIPPREFVIASVTSNEIRVLDPLKLAELNLPEKTILPRCGEDRSQRRFFIGHREIDLPAVCGSMVRADVLEVRKLGTAFSWSKRGALVGAGFGFLLGLTCIQATTGARSETLGCLVGNTAILGGLGALIFSHRRPSETLIYKVRSDPEFDRPLRAWTQGWRDFATDRLTRCVTERIRSAHEAHPETMVTCRPSSITAGNALNKPGEQAATQSYALVSESQDESATSSQSATVATEHANSINVRPLGLIFGTYNLNYERLFFNTHGLLVDASFSQSDRVLTSDGGKLAYRSYKVGYRRHLRRRQSSEFVGVDLGYKTNNTRLTIHHLNGTKSTFPVDYSGLFFGGNFGRRWAWESGLNITLGVGGGFDKSSFSSNDPDAPNARILKAILTDSIPVYLQAELSIGFTF